MTELLIINEKRQAQIKA